MARQIMEFKSEDYGIFLIQQHGKRWLVAWDPECCCEYHGIEPEEVDCGFFEDLFTYCMANPNNLSSKDFKDLPKNGEFNSLEEAKQYIETKFGIIY
jgi:hypothetical protein